MENLKDRIKKLRSQLSVTKITATRSLKGPQGEIFLGYSANFETCQLDATRGLLMETEHEVPAQAKSLSEAKLASHLLAYDVDVGVLQHALASGTLSEDYVEEMLDHNRRRYTRLIAKELSKEQVMTVPKTEEVEEGLKEIEALNQKYIKQ